MSQPNPDRPLERAAEPRSLSVHPGIIVGLIIFWACSSVWLGQTEIAPLMWGPYWIAFADSGPIVISRLGPVFIFSVVPVCVAINFFRKPLKDMVKAQLVLIAIWSGLVLGYGYYLHTIVHSQGVAQSLEALAAEVGYADADHVPQHIKAAFVLSDDLANEGAIPWLPGAWRHVDWPKPDPAIQPKKN